jgi:hypothetical protein
MEAQTITAASHLVQSLSTTGLLITAVTAVIFFLAKFGVFNKILDKTLENTSFFKGSNPKTMDKILLSIDGLLENDKRTDIRLTHIEAISAHRTEQENEVSAILRDMTGKIASIEKSQYEYKMESYKKTVFDPAIPLIDRMAAGIKFMTGGGNSETKKYILEKMAYEDLILWNGLCKALDALAYWRHEKDRPPESE